MKKRILLLLCICVVFVMTLLGLTSCGETCQHRDINDDSLCDKCGESYTDGKDVFSHCEANGHTPSIVEENKTNATCALDGSYDLVTYCLVCKIEISRENKVITALGHSPKAAIEENRVGTACINGGNYDSVIYCSVCNSELSRTNKIIEKTGIHTMSDGACIYCSLPESSEGLKYSLNSDEKSYTVTKGSFSGTDLVIGVYNNLSVTIIGDWAFENCTSLTSVTIPDSVTSIEIGAFENCTSLKSITIPDSVTSIGEYAFSDCRSLTSVTIPDSVTSIGKRAFSGCSGLTSVTISDSVTSIESRAFENCTSLNNIKVSENNSAYKDIDGNLYTKDGKTLIQYAMGKTATSFTVPDSVTSIGDYAFYNCDSLTNISIPDSVTSIGKEAFYNCDSLTSVTIPDSIASIGKEAFSGCDNLTSVTICNGVTCIGDGAFSGCESLTSVTIPDSVTSIGNKAFAFCPELTSIKYRGTEAEWNAITKGDGWDYGTGRYTVTYNYKGE